MEKALKVYLMKASILSLTPVLLLIGLSCEKDNGFTAKSCTVGFGESASCGMDDLTVLFRGVEDSRCPIRATCVWEGEVKVDLSVNEQPVALVLNSSRPEQAFDTIGSFILELKSVLPLPELDVEIPEEDVLVEIAVNR